MEDFKLSLGRRARLTQLEAVKQGISGRKNVKIKASDPEMSLTFFSSDEELNLAGRERSKVGDRWRQVW